MMRRMTGMRYLRLFLVLGGFALVLALAGCGGDDNDTPEDAGGSESTGTEATPADGTGDGGGSDAEFDACSILTPEDVEAEIGSAPVPNDAPVGPYASCGYFDTLTNFVQFQVCECLTGSQFDDSSKAGAEALGVDLKPVDGVGDKAYWYAGILWAQKGDVSISVWISKASYFEDDGTALEGEALEALSLPDETALAVKLLERID
jgi:hypothetical protein